MSRRKLLRLLTTLAAHVWAGPYVWYLIDRLGFGPVKIAVIWVTGFLVKLIAELPTGTLASRRRFRRALLLAGCLAQASFCGLHIAAGSAAHSRRTGYSDGDDIVLFLGMAAEMLAGLGLPLLARGIQQLPGSDAPSSREQTVMLALGTVIPICSFWFAANGGHQVVWTVAGLLFLAGGVVALSTRPPANEKITAGTYFHRASRAIADSMASAGRSALRATSLVGRHTELTKVLGLTSACWAILWTHQGFWILFARGIYGVSTETSGASPLPRIVVLGAIWYVSCAIGTRAAAPARLRRPSADVLRAMLIVFGTALLFEAILVFHVTSNTYVLLAATMTVIGFAEGAIRAHLPHIVESVSEVDRNTVRGLDSVFTALSALTYLSFAALVMATDPITCWLGLSASCFVVVALNTLIPIDLRRLGLAGLHIAPADRLTAPFRLRWRMISFAAVVWATAVMLLLLWFSPGAIATVLASDSTPALSARLLNFGVVDGLGLAAPDRRAKDYWEFSHGAASPLACTATTTASGLSSLQLERAEELQILIRGDTAFVAFELPPTKSVVAGGLGLTPPRCEMNGRLVPTVVDIPRMVTLWDTPLLLGTTVVALGLVAILIMLAQQYFANARRDLEHAERHIYQSVIDRDFKIHDLLTLAMSTNMNMSESFRRSRRRGDDKAPIATLRPLLNEASKTSRLSGVFFGAFFGEHWISQSGRRELVLHWTWVATSEPTSNPTSEFRDTIIQTLTSAESPIAGGSSSTQDDAPHTTHVLDGRGERAGVSCFIVAGAPPAPRGEADVTPTVRAFAGAWADGPDCVYVDELQRDLLKGLEQTARAATARAQMRELTVGAAHADLKAINDIAAFIRKEMATVDAIEAIVANTEVAPTIGAHLAEARRIRATLRDLMRDRRIERQMRLARRDHVWDEPVALMPAISCFFDSRRELTTESGDYLIWTPVGYLDESIWIPRWKWSLLQTALLNAHSNALDHALVENSPEGTAARLVVRFQTPSPDVVAIELENGAEENENTAIIWRYGLGTIASTLAQLRGFAAMHRGRNTFMVRIEFPVGGAEREGIQGNERH
jgi:hypothetical protein